MKKYIVIIAVLLGVLVIGALFVFMQMSKRDFSSGDSKSASQSGDSVEFLTGSIKSLVDAGKAVACDITYKDNQGTGKVYVADKKFRGDFDTIVSGKTVISHMLQGGSKAYVWTDDSKQGSKFVVDAMLKPTGNSNPQIQQSADVNANVDMKCRSWAVDDSKFIPPAEITFMDMTSMMNSTSGAATTSSAPKLDASFCNALTDVNAKAACITSLSK